tara:strand:- start:1035 stop:1427 length:393 start_codon:yes stop_codon:yes gene_type:complete
MSDIPTTDDGEYYVQPYTNILQPIHDYFSSMTEEQREAFFTEQEAQRIKRDEEYAIKQAEREAAYIQNEVDEGMAFPDYVWEVCLYEYDNAHQTISIHKSRESAQAYMDEYDHCEHEGDSMSIIRHEVSE